MSLTATKTIIPCPIDSYLDGRCADGQRAAGGNADSTGADRQGLAGSVHDYKDKNNARFEGFCG